MLVAVFLLFATGLTDIFSAGGVTSGKRAWALLLLLAKLTGFLTLVWGCYFLLHSNNAAFGRVLSDLISGGKAARDQQSALITNWGGNFVQFELIVSHSVEEKYIEELHQPDDKPTFYLHKTKLVPLVQESIIGFHGDVKLHQVDKEQTTYECAASYQYDVVNNADVQTIAQYLFPIPANRLYKNISVKLDGQLVAWTIETDGLHWQAVMSPHQQSKVEISFETRGAYAFLYQIPTQRVIRNFSLIVAIDVIDVYSGVSPQSDSVKSRRLENGAGGVVMDWTIHQAIMAPLINVYFSRPAKTELSTTSQGIVNYASRALILLISLLALTLMICRAQVRLSRLALVGCLFCAQYLVMIAFYPISGNYFWLLLTFSLFTLLLSFLAFKDIPRLPLILALMLIGLFGVIYPFVGLLPGERERNAIDGGVQAGMILYIFGLTLYTRIWHRE